MNVALLAVMKLIKGINGKRGERRIQIRSLFIGLSVISLLIAGNLLAETANNEERETLLKAMSSGAATGASYFLWTDAQGNLECSIKMDASDPYHVKAFYDPASPKDPGIVEGTDANVYLVQKNGAVQKSGVGSTATFLVFLAVLMPLLYFAARLRRAIQVT